MEEMPLFPADFPTAWLLGHKLGVDDSDLLAFAPVPVRFRSDGWTPRRQYFFILGIAYGFAPAKAAAILGMTRKSAYELRRRRGGEGFASAWAAAVRRAKRRRFAAPRPSLSQRAIEGEWHARSYRGRLTRWEHRPANARAMGLLKRLDRQADDMAPGTDVAALATYLATLRPEGDETDANPSTRCRKCHLPRRPGP